jgi:menaquinone-dependent protoporphyrinogen IX oxidase
MTRDIMIFLQDYLVTYMIPFWEPPRSWSFAGREAASLYSFADAAMIQIVKESNLYPIIA